MNLRFKADLALGATMLIWGATFVVVQNALAFASVFSFLSVRFIFATVVMAVVYWRTLRDLDRATILAGTLMGIFLFAGYICQTAGLKFTTPSKAAFLNGSSAVLVPIMLAVFGGRRISRWAWLGALVATLGLYFLAVPPSGFAHLNRGDILSFGSAIAFGLHIIIVGRYSRRHSVVGLSFMQVAVTAVLATIAVPLLAAMRWEAPRFETNSNLIFAVLVTAIGCSVLGFTLQVWAQKHTTSTHAAILFTLEPVFAAITSFVVLHERLSGRSAAGAVLIFIAILLSELKGPVQASLESTGPVSETAEAETAERS
ncbi:MAG: DMT family transporter [Candidatus Acidiferrales bacterium]